MDPCEFQDKLGDILRKAEVSFVSCHVFLETILDFKWTLRILVSLISGKQHTKIHFSYRDNVPTTRKIGV